MRQRVRASLERQPLVARTRRHPHCAVSHGAIATAAPASRAEQHLPTEAVVVAPASRAEQLSAAAAAPASRAEQHLPTEAVVVAPASRAEQHLSAAAVVVAPASRAERHITWRWFYARAGLGAVADVGERVPLAVLPQAYRERRPLPAVK